MSGSGRQFHRRRRWVFVWLLAAALVDATDGPLAGAWRVNRWAGPRPSMGPLSWAERLEVEAAVLQGGADEEC